MTRCVIKEIFLPVLKNDNGFFDVATNKTIGFRLLEIKDDELTEREYTFIELTSSDNVSFFVNDIVEFNSGYVYSFFDYDEKNRIVINMTHNSLLKKIGKYRKK